MKKPFPFFVCLFVWFVCLFGLVWFGLVCFGLFWFVLFWFVLVCFGLFVCLFVCLFFFFFIHFFSFFLLQVNKAKLASKIHLKRVKNAAKSMSASIKKLAKDGRAAIKSIVSATAKKVTSTASAIRKLAEEGRIARKAAERKRKRLVKDARALVSNVRDKLKTSLDNVKQAVTLTASSIAKDSIFVGRAKDANKALQNIVLGELRKSRSGIVQVATGLAQMGGLVPGKVGQQLASIGARARNLFIPGAVGQRIGQITGQIQNIANKIGSARKTVDQIGSVLKNIRKKGIKGALKSLLKVRIGRGKGRNTEEEKEALKFFSLFQKKNIFS